MKSFALSLLVAAVAFAAEPRDPFAPTREKQTPEPTCQHSLCKNSLDELRLVAIVSGSAAPVAMFETRSGTGLMAKLNQQIGNRGGHVSAISSDCVTVTTFVNAPDGRRLAQDDKVCLSHDAPQEHELMSDTEIVVP